MSDIYEDITSALYNALKKRKISGEKFSELKDKAGKAHTKEAVEAAIRDYKNPDYKGPNVLIKRKEGTHEAYGLGSWAKHSIKAIDDLKKENEDKEEKIEEEIATSIAGTFGVTPNDVIGRPAPFKKEGKKRQKKAMMDYRYQKIRNVNEDDKMSKIEESYDAIIEAITSILEGGPEIPQFMEDEKRHKKVEAAVQAAREWKAKKEKAQADAKKYQDESTIHLRKSVRGDGNEPGPTIK